MDEEIWFVVSVPLRAAPPEDALTLREVAFATSRSVAAVKRAVSDGRLPRVSNVGPPGQRSTRIHAKTADLNQWRRRSLPELLAERPDLPQSPEGWITQAGLARELGISSWAAHALIRRLAPPRLEGASSPFRPDIWYWAPDRSALASRGLVRTRSRGQQRFPIGSR